MANKYLKRRFTLREIALLIALLLVLFVGLYFGLVYYPINNRVNDLRAQQEELDLTKTVVEAQKASYDSMSEELKKIYATPEAERTYMPEFDNYNNLVAKFAIILSGVTYRITWSTPTLNDGVYTRNIAFSLEGLKNYEQAKSVLDGLMGTGYRCQMQNLTLSPSGGDISTDALSISCTIVFYEIEKQS